MDLRRGGEKDGGAVIKGGGGGGLIPQCTLCLLDILVEASHLEPPKVVCYRRKANF